MIRCKNVCKSYDTKAVLNGIDLDIPDGRFPSVIYDMYPDQCSVKQAGGNLGES